MESKYQREIESGKEFDHLFPRATGTDKTIRQDAGVEDTLAFIMKNTPKTLFHTKQIAAKLQGKNLYDTCHRVWDFVYNHVQYKKDKPGTEQVRSPRRVWYNRATGVDCDCYTSFISSILLNLGIAHKLRIAIYNPANGYQHIYPVVPKDGKLDYDLKDREDYIVIDCVKDRFDDEQSFLQIKDYPMKLDYLDGIEDRGTSHNTEASELAELAWGDTDLGSWWSRLTNTNGLKRTIHSVEETAKKVGQEVEHSVNEAAHFLNRFANPATILLRNGFLLSMKLNLMNVAHKLRYGYMTDEQATAIGMNLEQLQHVRNIKNRAETVYWQAGGLKENLKKGILTGKGNKDHAVPMDGLGSLGAVYADMDEYTILHTDLSAVHRDEVSGLGEPITLTAIAAASAAVGTLAVTLSQVKGIFKPGTPEAKKFDSILPDPENPSSPDNASGASAGTDLDNISKLLNLNAQSNPNTSANAGSSLPASSGAANTNTALTQASGNSNLPAPASTDTVPDPNAPPPPEGFIAKATDWIKTHPIPTAAILVAFGGISYLIYKGHHHEKFKKAGLHGIPIHRVVKKHTAKSIRAASASSRKRSRGRKKVLTVKI